MERSFFFIYIYLSHRKKKTAERDRHKRFFFVKFVEPPPTRVVDDERNVVANKRSGRSKPSVNERLSAWRTRSAVADNTSDISVGSLSGAS